MPKRCKMNKKFRSAHLFVLLCGLITCMFITIQTGHAEQIVVESGAFEINTVTPYFVSEPPPILRTTRLIVESHFFEINTVTPLLPDFIPIGRAIVESNTFEIDTVTPTDSAGGPGAQLPIASHPEDQRTVGAITIFANQFEDEPDGRVKGTNSVWIGEYLSVSQDGFVLIDGLSVTGRGTLSLLTPAGFKPLFQGSFSVDVTTGEVKEQGLVQSTLDAIAGFSSPVIASLRANAIEGTVAIQARLDLNLPGVSAAATGEGPDSDGDGYPDVQEEASRTDKNNPDDFPQEGVVASVEYILDHQGNARGQVDDFGIFLAGLTFHLEGGTLVEDRIAIQKATLKLPSVLGGLEGEVRGLEIFSDVPYIQFKRGRITLPQILIGRDTGGEPLFAIGASVELGTLPDGTGFFFSGSGMLRISNPRTEIDAFISIQTESPYLREARLSIRSASQGIPLGATGAFLTGGSGGLKLVPNFELSASVDVGFGLYIPNKGYPIAGTPSFTVARERTPTDGDIQTLTTVAFEGMLSMYQFITLDGSIVYRTTGDFEGALAAHIDLRLIRVDGEMNIHIWKDMRDKKLHFAGQITAAVAVPEDAVLPLIPPRDWQLAEVDMFFGEFRRGNMEAFGIKASVEILGIDAAVFIDQEGEVDWGTNLDSIVLVDQVPVAAAPMRALGRLANAQQFEFVSAPIGVGTDFVIFVTEWENGDLSITLVKPDGSQVTPETANSDDLITFLSDGTAQTYIVRQPEAGEWKLRIDDLDGDENYRLQVLGAKPAPSIQLRTPASQNESGTPNYTIQWNADDPFGTATISLYYDDDSQGADGIAIVTGLEGTAQNYEWDTASVPTGEYYIYALIDDTKNTPGISYSTGTVQVLDNTPPSEPVGFSATPSSEALVLHWEPNTEVDLASYNLYYRRESETDRLVANAGLETTYRLTNLINGQSYALALSVVDTSGNESPLTSEIIAAPTADADVQAPTPPTGLMVDVVDGGIALSWGASPDADVAGYKLHYGYAETPPFLGTDAQEGVSPIDVGGATNFRLTGLTPGTRYYFGLTAVDSSGNESELSEVASANFIADIDSDSDGLLDDWEMAHFGNLNTTNAADADGDSDGLSNIAEYNAGTSPVRPDTDADRVPDGEDPQPNGKTDADGDFLSDDWEAVHNLSEAEGDEDGDGATNLAEYIWRSNPNVSDTDGDGATDFEEILAKTDPNDSQSLPGQPADTLPPVVLSHHPTGDRVPTEAEIRVVFNEPMDAQTLTAQTIEVLAGTETIAGQVTYEANTNRFIFTPDSPLPTETQVTITVKHTAADVAGNTLDGNFDGKITADANDDYQWSFTTAPPPTPPWDVNSDGRVDIFDLVIVGGQFGQSGTDVTGDVNSDEKVDIFDLVIVVGHFGEITAGASALQLSDTAMPPPITLIATVAGDLLQIHIHPDNPTIYGLQLDLRYPSGLKPVTVNSGLRSGQIYWHKPTVDASHGVIDGAALTQLSEPMRVTPKASLITFTFRMDNPTHFYREHINLLNLYLIDQTANPLYVSHPSISVKLEDILVPEKTALAQNYPNPFNPETWIPYTP